MWSCNLRILTKSVQHLLAKSGADIAGIYSAVSIRTSGLTIPGEDQLLPYHGIIKIGPLLGIAPSVSSGFQDFTTEVSCQIKLFLQFTFISIRNLTQYAWLTKGRAASNVPWLCICYVSFPIHITSRSVILWTMRHKWHGDFDSNEDWPFWRRWAYR